MLSPRLRRAWNGVRRNDYEIVGSNSDLPVVARGHSRKSRQRLSLTSRCGYNKLLWVVLGGIIDLARFGELGNRGVLALMSESTNVERPGYTKSERSVGDSFKKLFTDAEGKRIIPLSGYNPP